MTAWIFVVVAHDGGMCKATTPGVKQSRASQWRARVSRRLGVSANTVNCEYAYTSDLDFQNRISKLFMVIGDYI